MTESYRCALHWFRRDLRVSDNTGFFHACETGAQVVPVFVLSHWEEAHAWTGPKRQQFLCQSLTDLDQSLRELGGSLVVRSGDAVDELTRLITEQNIDAVFFNCDPDPFGLAQEKRLTAWCKEHGVAVHAFWDHCLHPPTAIKKGDGDPYRVFTPFSKPWLAADKAKPLPAPERFASPNEIDALPLPTLDHWKLSPDWDAILPGGETEGKKRLELVKQGRMVHYDTQRDVPGELGTSRLSQDLRWGTISVRELFSETVNKGSEQYPKELAWREFYFQILYHYPEVLEKEFNPSWRGLPWDEPGAQWEAFQKGETGFPIVDAGIRELLATGFMHNRVRMIVAMFLTKDLHLDWKLGESFFMQHLVDGEIALNNGGWQWSAGTGADAAPYFRIQNPWSQTKRHDPQGRYIRKWVPELAVVASAALSKEPEAGKSVGPGYPQPIVNHGAERLRTLEIFKKHKAQQNS